MEELEMEYWPVGVLKESPYSGGGGDLGLKGLELYRNPTHPKVCPEQERTSGNTAGQVSRRDPLGVGE